MIGNFEDFMKARGLRKPVGFLGLGKNQDILEDHIRSYLNYLAEMYPSMPVSFKGDSPLPTVDDSNDLKAMSRGLYSVVQYVSRFASTMIQAVNIVEHMLQLHAQSMYGSLERVTNPQPGHVLSIAAVWNASIGLFDGFSEMTGWEPWCSTWKFYRQRYFDSSTGLFKSYADMMAGGDSR